MKVTKAKCLNTDLVRRLLSKSPRFRTTARFGPFPLGLAPRAAALFWQLELATVGWERFRPSNASDVIVQTPSAYQRRLPAYEVAKATKGQRGNKPITSLLQRRRQLAAKRSAQIRVQALCFGDFHLGQQMKVTGQPGPDPARCRAQRQQLHKRHV
jgi:hypothetical protein